MRDHHGGGHSEPRRQKALQATTTETAEDIASGGAVTANDYHA